MADEKELKCLDCFKSFKPTELSLRLENADTAFCEVSGMFHRFEGPFVLSYNDGKAVQEILNRYVNEELRPRLNTNNSFHGVEDDEDFQLAKDIDYITGLAKLFD